MPKQPPYPKNKPSNKMSRAEADAIAADKRFNTTLGAKHEAGFQAWKAANAPNDSGYDYDLRGAYKAGLKRDKKSAHFDDAFKKPNHPTFSTFSNYAKHAPERAGTWKRDSWMPPKGKKP